MKNCSSFKFLFFSVKLYRPVPNKNKIAHIYTVKKDSSWLYPRRLFWTLPHQMMTVNLSLSLGISTNPCGWQMLFYLIPFMVVTKFSESAHISMAAHKIHYCYSWLSIDVSREKKRKDIHAHTQILKRIANNTCLTLSSLKSFSCFFSHSHWEASERGMLGEGLKCNIFLWCKRQCS